MSDGRSRAEKKCGYIAYGSADSDDYGVSSNPKPEPIEHGGE
jgi:hypothetical protein